MAEPLVILFEDNHCLAVAKPAPLLTQAPPGVPSLEAQVKDYLRTAYHKPGKVYLGIPHRLDRAVSGAIVFARNTKAARRLAEQFQTRQVRKIYWALVEPSADGSLPPDEGVWEDWLRKLPEAARSEVVEAGTADARHCVLRFRCLWRGDQGALIEMEPATGRMHQIRVQAASRGWPVRGDFAYGARQSFGPPVELPRDCRIALHARRLTFLHPIRFEPITVTAAVDSYWPERMSKAE